MKAKVRRMFEVGSTMVHKVGFDPTSPGVDRGYLVVQFSNFEAYGYADVSYFDALLLLNAESVGTTFNTIIRDKYKGALLTKRDTHIVHSDSVSKPKPKEVDELPMLDVIGVDSSAGVGKVASTVRRKK